MTKPFSSLTLLYLDFDGVLHPDAVYRQTDGRIVLRGDGVDLFMHSPVLEEILRPYPELRIILSTTWVPVLGFQRAKSYLPATLRERVIGATFHSSIAREFGGKERWLTATSRHQQIIRHVNRNMPTAWLALDDDGTDWPDRYRDKLVLCDSDFGLGLETTRRELAEALQRIAERAP